MSTNKTNNARITKIGFEFVCRSHGSSLLVNYLELKDRVHLRLLVLHLFIRWIALYRKTI